MGKAHVQAKQIEADGHVFDSGDEHEYYQHLKQQENVSNIELQPQFHFMPSFYIECGRCNGGVVPSPKTGNPIKCKTCKGTNQRKRKPWTYKADFRVTYTDGKEEVVDVKGWENERFKLVRKMFEYQQGKELIVIKKKKGEWTRV